MQKEKFLRIILWGSPLLVFAFIPVFVESYYSYLLTTAAIYAISVLGVNLLTGNTGLVTVGHAGFFAIGAYASALMEVNLRTSLLTGMVAGGVMAAFVGFLLGVLTLRISGSFLAISTLGFGFTVSSLLMNWPIFQGRTGIMLGKPVLLGSKLSDISYYYFVFGFLIIFIVLTFLILRSGVGRALMAIKNSETAAQAMGVNPTFYKTLSFTISAFYAGVAGALFASQTQYLSAETFNFWMSNYFLIAVVVGGLGSIPGSVIGAFYIVVIPYLLKQFQDFSYILTGLILILVVVLAPDGIAGLLKRLYKRLFSKSKEVAASYENTSTIIDPNI